MAEWFAPLALLTGGNALVQGVLLVLVLASVLTWVIIFERWLHFANLNRSNAWFSEAFWSGRGLTGLYEEIRDHLAPGLTSVFVGAMREYLRLSDLKMERPRMLEGIQRILRTTLAREERDLSRRLPVLSVVASTSPYIGLFGTVWGIIDSFRSIGSAGQATLAAMAPGIAEALVATALGLFAAIPAAVAHNIFSAQAERQGGDMEDFAEDLLALIERALPTSGAGREI